VRALGSGGPVAGGSDTSIQGGVYASPSKWFKILAAFENPVEHKVCKGADLIHHSIIQQRTSINLKVP